MGQRSCSSDLCIHLLLGFCLVFKCRREFLSSQWAVNSAAASDSMGAGLCFERKARNLSSLSGVSFREPNSVVQVFVISAKLSFSGDCVKV